jgi:polyhydroxyalkanoate synthase
MTQGHEDFVPALQQFVQAGQVLTQSFLTYLGQQPGGAGALQSAISTPDAAAMQTLQREFVDAHRQLWQASMRKAQPLASAAAATDDGGFRVHPEPGDRRFSSAEWSQSPFFDYLRQSYLLNSRFVRDLVEILPVEEGKSKNRLRFLARQYNDALAPTNFAATNPEFIKTAIETKGQSITDGINNLIGDLDKGRISMTDESVFEVGKNIATTSGAVVFENSLFQLVQYTPTTDKVAKRPFLIVPPCINKFYILDLQPENSFVKFAVDQGHTVFLVSWRNPKESLAHKGWDDYLEEAAITAIHTVQKLCKVKEINALGFCVGGTILSSALAVLRARGEKPVSSLTLLTTLLDFSDTGEISLFIDEQMLASREKAIGKGGLLTAKELSGTFSALRANDLVWNYVANNYLKGKKPAAFDLLYWNSDSTNLPGPFACWYMRNLYHDNSLRVPGKLKMCGESVDLAKIDMPAYILATREDHIVPWQTAYLSTRLLGGDTRFVLGASGHIAGVINPASKNKRSHWLGGDQGAGAEDWLNSAEEKSGSWWSDWATWLAGHSGGQRLARKTLGSADFPVIEAAPGRYVKEKA